MSSRTLAVALLALCFVGFIVESSHAGPLYWTKSSTVREVQTADADGTNVITIHDSGADESRDLFLDAVAGRVYFTVVGTNATTIRRMDLDGTNVQDLVALGSAVPFSFDGDPGRNKMYWRQLNDIYSANLDGTSVTLIHTEPASLDAIAVDRSTGQLYLLATSGSDTVIRRMESDGTGVVDIITIPGETPLFFGFAVGNGNLYWGNFANDIRTAKTDGTGLGVALTATSLPFSIFVDESGMKLYWIVLGTGQGIFRANFDGTTIEQLTTDATAVAHVDIAVLSPPIPTVSEWGLLVLTLLCMVVGTVMLAGRRRLSS